MKFVHVKADGEKLIREAESKADIAYYSGSPRWELVVEPAIKEAAKNTYSKKEEPKEELKIEDVITEKAEEK